MILSRVFAMGDRREIGLYDDPIHRSLSGLGIEIILANSKFLEYYSA